MNIEVKEDHVLFTNDDGEYHMDMKDFDRFGEKKAEEYAYGQILLKIKSSHTGKTINFSQARELGFCEYGIKDFAKMLNLDIGGTYSIELLNELLTIETLREYPNECIKLFGKDTLKYLGGVSGILSEDTIDLVLRPDFIPEKTLHILSVKFAYSCLGNFEKEYPDDNRCRKAIEAKEAWIRGDITDKQLKAEDSAARSAAWSARSTTRAAWSAADSAAWSAARSARSTARAARSAARKMQVEIILKEK